MTTTFFKLPELPEPWNLFDDWGNEGNSGKHGITQTEITSECFYYLEILTDLLQKYGNHYSFDKLPEELKKISFDSSNLIEEIFENLINYSYRINFVCPTFQTFNLEKVRQLLITEFLSVIPTDEEIEMCASYAIAADIYLHISWVLQQISNWITVNTNPSQDTVDRLHLYTERNWRKIPEKYFLRLINQMFSNVYRINKIPGYSYGSEFTDKPLPGVLKDIVHTLQTENVLPEEYSGFIAELHYRIGGPEPPPDEDEED